MRRTFSLTSILVTGLLVIGVAQSEARNVRVSDSFENANAGRWAASGGVTLVRLPAKASAAQIAPHGGKSFLILTAPQSFPGASLTNIVTLAARNADRCTLELWAQTASKTGALAVAVRREGPTGALLGSQTVNAPIAGRGKGAKAYGPVKISFAYPGAPVFVSIDAMGPAEIAIDDFSVACRTR